MNQIKGEARLAGRQWVLDRLEEEISAVAEPAVRKDRQTRKSIDDFPCRTRHLCRRLMAEILSTSGRLMPQIRVLRLEIDAMNTSGHGYVPARPPAAILNSSPGISARKRRA